MPKILPLHTWVRSNHTLLRNIIRTILVAGLFFFVFSVPLLYAADVTLEWDPNPEEDVIGYKVYYGVQSGSYTEIIDVGNYTSCVIAGLENEATYYFTLTAYNTAGYESDYSEEVTYDSLSAVAINEPPIANAGPIQDVSEGATVKLSGVNSSDADDGIASYEWRLINGPSLELSGANSAEAFFIAPQVESEGISLTFALTVTDCSGQTSTDTCIVNVTALNEPPIADAGADQTVGEGETVMLNAINSVDLDDGVAAYEWRQTEGPGVALSSSFATQPTFTAPGVGFAGTTLVFQLTVTDHGGLQSSDTCAVNVVVDNIPPEADAGPDQTTYEGNVVTLDAINSKDYDGSIVSFFWKQVDGIAVTLSNPMSSTPIFTAPSVNWKGDLLTFELTVTDNKGLQSTDSCSIAVDDSRFTDSTDTSIPVGLDKKIRIK